MAELHHSSFDYFINDDILYMIIGNYFSIKEKGKLMKVCRRWKNICVHLFKKVRTLSSVDFNAQALEKSPENITAMLKLFPRLKCFKDKFEFLHKKREFLVQIIRTLAKCNPLIEELRFSCVNEEVLEEIIQGFGTKLKVLNVNYSVFDSEKVQKRLFDGLPNLEELSLVYCWIIPSMFQYFPKSCKKFSLLHYNDDLAKNFDIINALSKSDHVGSIEHLSTHGISLPTFDLICEHLRGLKVLMTIPYGSINAKNLRKLKNLKEICLRTDLREENGNVVIENTRNLELIGLSRYVFDLNGLKLLTELSPNIKHLILNNSYKEVFTDQVLNVLCCLKNLHVLTIYGRINWTENGMINLLSSCPNLSLVYLGLIANDICSKKLISCLIDQARKRSDQKIRFYFAFRSKYEPIEVTLGDQELPFNLNIEKTGRKSWDYYLWSS